MANHQKLEGHETHIDIAKAQVAVLTKKYHIHPNCNLQKPIGPIPPVAGLKVQKNGKQCKQCGVVVVEKSSQQSHMSSCHKHDAFYGESTSSDFWEDCDFQQFFRNRHRYFKVYPEMKPTSSDDHFASYFFKAKSAFEVRGDFIPLDTHDRGEANVWLAESGWPKVVVGHNPQSLMEMVSLHDPISLTLDEACRSFIKQIAQQASHSNLTVRRWLLSTTK